MWFIYCQAHNLKLLKKSNFSIFLFFMCIPITNHLYNSKNQKKNTRCILFKISTISNQSRILFGNNVICGKLEYGINSFNSKPTVNIVLWAIISVYWGMLFINRKFSWKKRYLSVRTYLIIYKTVLFTMFTCVKNLEWWNFRVRKRFLLLRETFQRRKCKNKFYRTVVKASSEKAVWDYYTPDILLL